MGYDDVIEYFVFLELYLAPLWDQCGSKWGPGRSNIGKRAKQPKGKVEDKKFEGPVFAVK